MNAFPLLAVTVVASYLVGAVPFGYLVARWRGVDLRRQGSGNIGATNVGRVLGRRFGILVFVLDFAKGALPVAAAGMLSGGGDLPPQTLQAAAGVAAFLGHLFPVYLRFRGGKGVATGAGVVAVLVPYPMLGALLTWVVVLVVGRYVSLASLAAVVALCGLRLALTPQPWDRDHGVVTAFCFVAAALVFVRHHGNIRRLLHGNENRIKESPAMHLLAKTLHALALGLWFGTAVFFLAVGWSLFQTFERVSQGAEHDGAAYWWLPPPRQTGDGQPDEQTLAALRKEQGVRLAGTAVGPLFGWYFAVQAGAGVLALAAALPWWSRRAGAVHKVRVVVLVLALGTAFTGWRQAQRVSGLGDARDRAVGLALQNPEPTPAQVQDAEVLRRIFGREHGYSMALNLITVALVTVGMALAAQLPEARKEGKEVVVAA